MAGKTMAEWIREMSYDELLKCAIGLKDRIEKSGPLTTSARQREENSANLQAYRDEWKRRETLRRQRVQ
jgi:hypothetical protein